MKNLLRFLFILFLVAISFLAGIAWTNASEKWNTEPEKKEQEKTVLIDNPTSPPSSNTRPTTPSQSLRPEEQHTIHLFESAAPSVAFITTSNVRQDYWTRDITEIPRGTGSGFVWDKQGHIITNYHVIQGADRAEITLADQSQWSAKLVGKAPEKDLAVLKIEAPLNILAPIPVGESENLRVGQAVYAIGNPFGLDQTLTTGIISALGREINSVANTPIRDVIQTDAAINPGNSGGPLLDSSGRLIGVNTAIYSPSGAYAGIGFSIPVDAVRWIVPELIEHGRILRPSLGVELASPQINRRIGVEGALIIDVIPNSAAEKAGILPTIRDRYGRIRLGDVIIGINEEKITSSNEISLALEQFKVGEKITLQLLRGEKVRKVELVLDPAR